MFIIAIFTAKEVKDQFVRCFKECGAIIPIKSGFPDTVYLHKLSVPQNVFTWMEQIATKKNEEYNPHPSHGCFQVESREQHSLECHGCFQITQKWSLSKLTFLVSLKVDVDAIEKLTCTFKVANGCKDFQLMPNIMCDYAAKFRNCLSRFDQASHGSRFSRRYRETRISSSRKFLCRQVERKRFGGIWGRCRICKCVLCLTSKRKVVLISIIQRYVWVVDSKISVNCKECDGKVFHGAQFSCNQYLRQVPVVKARNYIEVSLRRKRQSLES